MADVQPNQLPSTTTTSATDIAMIQNGSTGEVDQVLLSNLIPNGVLPFAKLNATIQTYTPTYTMTDGAASAVAGYYASIGGLKLSWGRLSGNNSASSTAHVSNLTYPPSFFTATHVFLPTIAGVGGSAHQLVSGDSAAPAATGVSFYIKDFDGGGTNSSWYVQWLIIGT